MTPLSYPRIAAWFHRDHTTVLWGERRIRQLIIEKPKVAAYVRECRALVKPRDKERDRELVQQPLVTIHADADAQACLPLRVRQHAQGGGGFSERGTCEGESQSSRAEAETGGGHN
jgi:hypothetical protein